MTPLPFLLAFATAQAAVPAPVDPRIVVVTYGADQVHTLSVTPGYAAVVALGPASAVRASIQRASCSGRLTKTRITST